MQHFLAVKISTHQSELIIATTYARPNAGIPYGDVVGLFNHTHLPVYLLGDLNGAHTAFNHPRTNAHGRELYQILRQKNLRFLGPDFPTIYTANGTGRPDLAFTNRRSLPLHHHMSPGQPCGSDHLPVILRISSSPISVPSPTHYQYNRANWNAFKEELNSFVPTPLEGAHHTILDDEVERVHAAIQHAAETHIPKTNHKIYRDFRPSIRTQRLTACYRARFRAYGNDPRRHERDLGILRRHVLQSLLHDHGTHWQNIITQTESLRSANATQFWRRISCLRGAPKDRFQHLVIGNHTISDPQQVADAFRDHWQAIFHPHPLPAHPPSLEHIRDAEDQLRHHDTAPIPIIDTTALPAGELLTTPFTEAEVKTLLQHTRRRAPGPQGITWAMARHLPEQIVKTLSNIYNSSLATGYFPIPFKTSTTILIPKHRKDTRHPDNYRPISLLEVTGKTFERLLNSRLRTHLETNNLLTPKQFGFRQYCSTESALNTILSFLHHSPQFKYAVVTKDVQKAFDTVWHEGLKLKICRDYDLPLNIQKLLCNFLNDRTIKIKHKNCFSPPFSPRAGVPQGSVLSPSLFNMYVNNIPDPTHRESLVVQYADDITLVSRARKLDILTDRLQTELAAMSLWEARWRITSHPGKASVTYLNIKRDAPRRLLLNPHIPNEQPIRQSHSTTILGVTLDDKKTFRNHITQKKAMANNTLSNLERFRVCTPRAKLHLYKTLIRPAITYCPLALSLAAKTNQLDLQRVQNKALRFVLDVRWDDFRTAESLHMETHVPPINTTLHNRLIKQLEKFRLTHNTTFEYIETLPPFRRPLPTKNLLHPDTHQEPAPLYK